MGWLIFGIIALIIFYVWFIGNERDKAKDYARSLAKKEQHLNPVADEDEDEDADEDDETCRGFKPESLTYQEFRAKLDEELSGKIEDLIMRNKKVVKSGNYSLIAETYLELFLLAAESSADRLLRGTILDSFERDKSLADGVSREDVCFHRAPAPKIVTDRFDEYIELGNIEWLSVGFTDRFLAIEECNVGIDNYEFLQKKYLKNSHLIQYLKFKQIMEILRATLKERRRWWGPLDYCVVDDDEAFCYSCGERLKVNPERYVTCKSCGSKNFASRHPGTGKDITTSNSWSELIKSIQR